MTAQTCTPALDSRLRHNGISEQNLSTRSHMSTGTLGTPAITMMVIAAAAPLTVLSGGTPLGILNGTGAGFPTSFLIVGAALLLFSIGFAAMTRRVGGSGAFFNAIGHGLHPALGLGSSMLALFTYATIQVGICCFLGMQITVCLEPLVGATTPWWAWSLITILVSGILGYRNIAMSAGVLNVLIAGEIGVALVLCVAVFAHHAPTGIDFASTFTPSAAFGGAPGVAVIFAIASFVGFESTAIYRSEARDPDVTVPRATYVAVVFVALLYTASSFAIVTAWCTAANSAGAADTAAALSAGDMLQVTAERYVGGWFSTIVSVLIITSLFAAVLSFHNVLARYLQSMADARALPSALGRVSARRGSPTVASLTTTVISATIVVAVAVAGLDPFTQVFSWFSGVAVLGFVTLLVLTCVAVVATFARRADLRAVEGPWRAIVAPTAGAVLLIAILACSLMYFPHLVGELDATGTPAFGPICAALVACAAGALIAGVVEACIMRRANTRAYRELERALAR
ncbi:APC family permease [Bifidobacterium pseudolongum]|uniref:Amino acid transporter n=1 Tax=Bifidobacterium pseudolongum subsp. globosum TaxID=1690 RepID=A0A2N3QUL7_9BIFI|nr:APC family permease [Bifidobacterium pseudolongum]PKU95790.1 amino acid transporter [Bifidobacterium pseudolongum subsp. globosum]PKV04447.1 amino acid transporter [Bifidobacterium pseudolongum subsp. globosum]RYQ75870.1 amino acid transporter [Bifidobacterium pseudolongum subsp. globosum]RYQ77007.1 amino acid transporter [Bifidobacterium pseudolongum subsp. globosum]